MAGRCSITHVQDVADALTLAVGDESVAGQFFNLVDQYIYWQVAGEIIDPRKLEKPVLTIVPGQDRIVPPASARALAPGSPIAPPQARALELALGHIGMVVSGRAPQMLWQPVTNWLQRPG